MKPRISCVICAYNEGERIGGVLHAVAGHPLLYEIVVIDDGSTDHTAARVREHRQPRLIELGANGGKAAALARGLAEARAEHVMLLDADLVGLAPPHVTALAAPVLAGQADSSISLRGDSLGVYRALKLDFVSGERVLPRALFDGALPAMAGLPRWGCEVFINELIIAAGLRVAVVDWPGVGHTPKRRKAGAWHGMTEDLRMVGDALRVLSPGGVVRQHVELKRLTRSA